MKLFSRLRTWRNRRRFEADLVEEIRIHREMAGAAAFGSEALALEQSREVWGFAWLDSWRQDIRYAARGLRKSPAFALAVIGSIGVGLGLNTTLFTIVNTYLLRPHAVRDPYSLYRFMWLGHSFTPAEIVEVPLRDAIGYREAGVLLEGRQAIGEIVTPNYFAALGGGMAFGRPILPGDRGVIVLSHNTWRNDYGADPGILGRTLHLRGEPYEVIGVAARGFVGVDPIPLAFWIPLTPAVTDLRFIGRLEPGMTADATIHRLQAWAQARSKEPPRILLRPAATMLPAERDALFTFLPLLVAFALILATACANVSNIMLARAIARRREMAIRISLGAGRWRLIRQLLTESMLLAAPAAAAGFVISQTTLAIARRLMYATMPAALGRVMVIADLSPDWRVFTFIVGAAVFTMLLFGLAPAVQTTRPRLIDAGPARLRNLLVVGQVAVCALLSIWTAVLLRSERRVSAGEPGLDTHGVWDLRMLERFRAKAASRLAAEPGVETVAIAWQAPLYNPLRQIPVTPSGGREVRFPGYNFVSSPYFRLFRIPVLAGRVFTDAESDAEAPVAVVSARAARQLWPGRDAVGQAITLVDGYRTSRLPEFRSARVIGVVGDVASAFSGLNGDETCVYFPTHARAAGNESILVRMAGDSAAGKRTLDAALDRIAPSLSDMVLPMDDIMAFQAWPFRVTWWVAAFLGGVALLMTVSGIYGVVTYAVSQRTKEIGIRVALGAQAADVARLVLRQSGRLAAIGLTSGAGLALAAAPLFAHVLAALDPFDAVAYAASVAVIFVAAMAASFAPARRALAIDPAVTLRGE